MLTSIATLNENAPKESAAAQINSFEVFILFLSLFGSAAFHPSGLAPTPHLFYIGFRLRFLHIFHSTKKSRINHGVLI